MTGQPRSRLQKMLLTVLVIYASFLTAGLLHEATIKTKYTSWSTGDQDRFTHVLAFMAIPSGVVWALGHQCSKLEQKHERSEEVQQEDEEQQPPLKEIAIMSIVVSLSTFTSTAAIYLTSFPLVMITKSCSMLMDGISCLVSRIVNPITVLQIKKPLLAATTAVSLIVFFTWDSIGNEDRSSLKYSAGILCLLISLVLDSLLPRLQATLGLNTKLPPSECLLLINKGSCLIAIILSIVTLQIFSILSFMVTHLIFTFHLLTFSVLSFIGQFFIFRMILHFQHHFIHFLTTFRKLLTVTFSLSFYHSQSAHFMQQIAVLLLIIAATFEVLSAVNASQQKAILTQKETLTLKQAQEDIIESELIQSSSKQQLTPQKEPKHEEKDEESTLVPPST